jgi:hypothetical protein
MYPTHLVKSAVENTPLLQRRSQRKLPKESGVSKSLIQSWIHLGLLNQESGATVWENTKMTQAVYRNLLENERIPAIMTMWPIRQKTIRIQQDGAKAELQLFEEI